MYVPGQIICQMAYVLTLCRSSFGGSSWRTSTRQATLRLPAAPPGRTTFGIALYARGASCGAAPYLVRCRSLNGALFLLCGMCYLDTLLDSNPCLQNSGLMRLRTATTAYWGCVAAGGVQAVFTLITLVAAVLLSQSVYLGLAWQVCISDVSLHLSGYVSRAVCLRD